MEALGVIQEQVRTLDARTTANHDSIRSLRTQCGDHETRISVITTELRETREDLTEIRHELTWVKRGLWAAAGTFLMFFVAALSLLAQLHG